MFSDFHYQATGKWILCGEHAVIRGKPALVFPFNSKVLDFKFSADSQTLTANVKGESGHNLEPLFWRVIKQALDYLQLDINALNGHFEIENQIPIGTGLGASAALSVAVSQWFINQGFLKAADCFSFSQKLENLFHEKSSGLDIIGSMSKEGVLFKSGHAEPLNAKWQPHFYLSFSGPIGITAHCVKQVEALFQSDKSAAMALDELMGQSTMMAYQALTSEYDQSALAKLTTAIEQAYHCFNEWQLTNDAIDSHINNLKQHGALAAKPTGSGSGGFILSLWPSPPPAELQDLLLKC